MVMVRFWLPLGVVLLALWGCGNEPIPARIQSLSLTGDYATGDYAAAPSTSELELIFLGTGGIYLQHGEQALLGDPFFSNPPITDWVLMRESPVRSDVIDRYLPPLEAVKAILVAHVHHDHAMDVPYIAAKTDPQVPVLGSETLRNTLFSALDPNRLIALNAKASGLEKTGEWVQVNQFIRILPILSGHAPHLFGRVLNSDAVQSPLPSVPKTVVDWESGQALSFVIDFLQAGQPKFRIFYQSSAADAPDGLPPAWLLQDGKKVDLALLGIANQRRLQEYPIALLQALQPQQVVLIHWELFWDEYSQQVTRPLPGLDLAGLMQKIEQALPPQVPVYLPDRGARLRIQESL